VAVWEYKRVQGSATESTFGRRSADCAGLRAESLRSPPGVRVESAVSPRQSAKNSIWRPQSPNLMTFVEHGVRTESVLPIGTESRGVRAKTGRDPVEASLGSVDCWLEGGGMLAESACIRALEDGNASATFAQL
jgi:hypothetical protein